MTSKCTLRIPVSQNIHFIYSRLKEHVIIYNPPYSILNILSPYISQIGREIKVVIEHASRNVSIVEGSICAHVLQTAILAFQQHRLPPSLPNRGPPSLPNRGPPVALRQDTGQECSICYDVIHQPYPLPCAHIFHRTCILQWLTQNPTCPVCRTHV